MPNINDYIKWRGDIAISSDFPFNEIDSMILARFSYLIFGRIDMHKVETIESISEKMRTFANDDFRYDGDMEMIHGLGQSRRFKSMLVTDFTENNEKESEKQFGAIVVHIDTQQLYISYIGTDASIYGWKEDFNMSFMENVPCQIEGKKYLERIAAKYPNKEIRIGGHSKGGNVAIYAGMTSGSEIQKRIIKIYNYDGPGFNQKIAMQYMKTPIVEKTETYFPQESIIGRIMNHREKCSIILSNQKGILQHDIYSWQVMGTSPVYTEKLTNISEIMNAALTSWLTDTSNEQRKIFIDTVFELFYSTDARTFGEISQNLRSNLSAIFKKYGQISKEDKKTMTAMIKLFIKEGFTEAMYFYGYDKSKSEVKATEKK